MRKERPSKTARKVAMNIVTLGAKPGMDEVLPVGIVDATATLLVESGAVGAVFVQCAAITGAGSRIAFTYVGTRADGRPDAGPWTRFVLWILKVGGESWLWSIRPEVLGPFLNGNSWGIDPNL